MRADTAGLRTWLLAAFAGWALLLWAATLFGLGGRIGNGGAAPEMPALPAVPRVEPAPVLDNAEALARPLFAGDRRPHAFFMGEAGTQNTGTVRLTGVLMTPGLDMATLTTEQGKSLRLRLGGDVQDGWQLLALQPRSATVSGPSGTMELELQVFSGGAKNGPAGMVAPAVPAPGNGPVPPPTPAAAAPAMAAEPAGPSAEQIQAIRERIQARRRQAQQNQNGGSGRQNP